MSEPRHFEAPWGNPLRWITGLTCGVLALQMTLGLCLHSQPNLARVLLVTLPPFFILGGALFQVRGYEVGRGQLLIRRWGWSTRISLEGLQSAAVDPLALRKSLRSCGNGGFFVFSGWFYNKRLGHYRVFATDLARAVVLAWSKRRVVVTPDDPEAFVRCVTQAMDRP